jgi:hypothetical protein
MRFDGPRHAPEQDGTPGAAHPERRHIEGPHAGWQAAQQGELPGGPPTRGYEITDVRVRGIVVFLIGLAALAVATHFGLEAYHGRLERLASERDRAAIESLGPAARPGEAERPAGPLLQSNPVRALAEQRAHEERLLSTYGWVNRDLGIARIPIDRAMEIVARRGLPTRGPSVTPNAGGGLVDRAPSDANSGRLTP